jgi:PDZ domain-containing protein
MIRRNSTLRFSRTPSLLRFILIFLTVVALAAPMNFVMITPGPATPLFPKVLTIKESSGVKTYPVRGQINLLTIYVSNPESYVSGAEVLGCWAWGDCVVLPRSVMYRDGTTDKQEIKSGTKDMVQSQNLALIAARAAIGRKYPDVNLSQVKDSSVKVSLENTGGPSGGLVFTLGLIDLLTPTDLLQGRIIAGTGTISKDGSIGAIGGVQEKIIGAKKAGASLLFVSQENCRELPARVEGITVVAISNIDEAIDYLAAPYTGGIWRSKKVISAEIRGCASVGA